MMGWSRASAILFVVNPYARWPRSSMFALTFSETDPAGGSTIANVDLSPLVLLLVLQVVLVLLGSLQGLSCRCLVR